jgi:4-alpha-glucanotransferase
MAPAEDLLDELARRRGIAPSYVDVEGKEHAIARTTKARLLAAMGLDVSSPAATARALEAERVRDAPPPVPRVRVVRKDGTEHLPLSIPARAGEAWRDAALRVVARLRGENGELLQLDLSRAVSSGAPPLPGRARIDVPLTNVPAGEWEAEVQIAGDAPETAAGVLYVTPPHCYLPPAVERGEKLYGFSAQLYSLPNLDNGGVGTLAGAREAASFLGKEFGCQLFGLSPLHATPNRDPHDFSPYCPDSREWRSVAYLDLTACPEVQASPRARAELDARGTRQELDALARAPRVPYQRAVELKLRILGLAFADFRASASGARSKAFAAFVEAGGESLARFCEFAARRGGEPPFHAFCQWLLEDQLASVQNALRSQGFLGLYQDLAVGSSGGGADAFADPELFLGGIEIGAPPDAFQKNGQTWGVAPMDPVKLRERAYAPFVRALRASMRHAAAVRLDHVMGLWRLWWVPRRSEATEGAYVEYPADDLLGLVALESWRCQCLVIGEDLGTVPHGVRQRMERERILGSRLVLFERTPGGAFLPPSAYAPLSTASFGSHDLPTFAGWWLGRDVELRTRLGLYKTPAEAKGAPAERERDRQALTELLASLGLLDSGARRPGGPTLDEALEALHAFLGGTSSILALSSLEDALGLEEQRNLPGTLGEYPNWTLRLGESIEGLSSNGRLAACARALRDARAGRPPRARA